MRRGTACLGQDADHGSGPAHDGSPILPIDSKAISGPQRWNINRRSPLSTPACGMVLGLIRSG
jgi:hypothetical protein